MYSAFQFGAFQSNAFQIITSGSVPPPVVTTLTQGYMSGSYVTRMTDAEFERRRKVFRTDMDSIAFRMLAKEAMPELHAALAEPVKSETFEQKRAREMRLSDIIDKQIRADHEREVKLMAAQRQAVIDAAEDDAEDEMIINMLLN
jgi:hypothetical protein